MAQLERPHPFTLPSLDLFSFMSAPFPRTQVDRDLNAMADLISDSSAFKPLNDVSQMFGLRGTSLAHAIPSGKIIAFLERTGLSDNLGVVEWISNITTRFFNQNRADHSLKVFDVAREWGTRLGLPDEKLKVACAVAICHDIGHRAWAHTGERLLRERGVPFDHDLFTCILASQPEYQRIFADLGMDGKEVVAAIAAEGILGKKDKLAAMIEVLRENGLPHTLVLELDESKGAPYEETMALLDKWEATSLWVQHYCDSLSYLEDDWRRSPRSHGRVKKIMELRESFMDAISFEMRGEKELLVLKNPESFDKFLLALLDKEVQMVLSVWKAWVEKLQSLGLKKAGVTNFEMMTQTETPLDKRIDPETRLMVKCGVDQFLEEAVRVTSRGRTIDGLSHKPSQVVAAIDNRLAELVARGEIASDSRAFATETAPYNREFPFWIPQDQVGLIPGGTSIKVNGRKEKYCNDPVQLYRNYTDDGRLEYEYRQVCYEISVPVRRHTSVADRSRILAEIEKVLDEMGASGDYLAAPGAPYDLTKPLRHLRAA